jgi:hypothetical protein
MITNALIHERNRVEAARDRLEENVFRRMEKIARRMNLDEMLFCMYGNRYLRGDKEVQSKQLDELDDFYCDNIHEGGFQGVWTKEKGWT